MISGAHSTQGHGPSVVNFILEGSRKKKRLKARLYFCWWNSVNRLAFLFEALISFQWMPLLSCPGLWGICPSAWQRPICPCPTRRIKRGCPQGSSCPSGWHGKKALASTENQLNQSLDQRTQIYWYCYFFLPHPRCPRFQGYPQGHVAKTLTWTLRLSRSTDYSNWCSTLCTWRNPLTLQLYERHQYNNPY